MTVSTFPEESRKKSSIVSACKRGVLEYVDGEYYWEERREVESGCSFRNPVHDPYAYLMAAMVESRIEECAVLCQLFHGLLSEYAISRYIPSRRYKNLAPWIGYTGPMTHEYWGSNLQLTCSRASGVLP